MQELFIPTLHTFENENIFTGSYNGLRFKITPQVVMLPGDKEVNFEESSMKAEYWHGLFCYEKSEIEEERIFPLSPEGREEMKQWLLEHV
ncbi:MAG: hypothetical protein J6J43_00370 [Oscillospiraceae bacterium]|nr:hypothetical protein [Oscillospiraceae bacterium]